MARSSRRRSPAKHASKAEFGYRGGNLKSVLAAPAGAAASPVDRSHQSHQWIQSTVEMRNQSRLYRQTFPNRGKSYRIVTAEMAKSFVVRIHSRISAGTVTTNWHPGEQALTILASNPRSSATCSSTSVSSTTDACRNHWATSPGAEPHKKVMPGKPSLGQFDGFGRGIDSNALIFAGQSRQISSGAAADIDDDRAGSLSPGVATPGLETQSFEQSPAESAVGRRTTSGGPRFAHAVGIAQIACTSVGQRWCLI